MDSNVHISPSGKIAKTGRDEKLWLCFEIQLNTIKN